MALEEQLARNLLRNRQIILMEPAEHRLQLRAVVAARRLNHLTNSRAVIGWFAAGGRCSQTHLNEDAQGEHRRK